MVALSDGDTITLLDSSKAQHKIRIAGIDAPERASARGKGVQPRSRPGTQNALANAARGAGLDPLSPRADEPTFDFAWRRGDELWVVEVKSLNEVNEEKQLWLGLGQVLRYRNLLQTAGVVRAVLAVERRPRDGGWAALCREVGVLLVWPENWGGELGFK